MKNKGCYLVEFLIILVILGILIAVAYGHADRDEFMRQCEKDLKTYECTAMWRAGEIRR